MPGDDSWKRIWDARIAALENILGPSRDSVFHATVPFALGGNADVVAFDSHLNGIVYVTADLTGEPGESSTDYELMICHRSESNWGPNIISQLGRYTQQAIIRRGETMDIGSASPSESKIAAFAFDTYATFELFGQDVDLRLCVGITKDELSFRREHGTQQLIDILKIDGVYPFTDLDRESVNLRHPER